MRKSLLRITFIALSLSLCSTAHSRDDDLCIWIAKAASPKSRYDSPAQQIEIEYSPSGVTSVSKRIFVGNDVYQQNGEKWIKYPNKSAPDIRGRFMQSLLESLLESIDKGNGFVECKEISVANSSGITLSLLPLDVSIQATNPFRLLGLMLSHEIFLKWTRAHTLKQEFLRTA